MKKKLSDRELVYYLMGGYWALWLWTKYESIIKDQRVRSNLPELGVWFEYLAKEMIKMREQRGHTAEIPEGWGAVTPNE